MKMKSPYCRPQEQGFAVLFAVATVAMLMAGALILMTQTANYAQIVGASSNAKTLAFVSDAGVIWGKNNLFALTHPGGPGAGLTLAMLKSQPNVPPQHDLCADGANCAKFHFVSPAQPVPFGGGTYVVAATCFPKDCNIADSELVGFEMRVLSALPSGAQRLFEITYMP